MGKLKVLPAQVANMIAAGEVVQRPASVVKELMENAVDAGATSVKVILKDSGRTLVQVIDNGCGMSAADAVLCFERHATSKISAPEDLGHILSYGFRGEALPSIAAVAEVTLKTRTAGDETGTQVTIGDFGAVKTSEIQTPVGSNFLIRNLFYNIPARRKFLKSDSVELKHAIEEFVRVALCHPEIEFSLSNNERDIHILRAAKSLKFRILDLMGSNVAEDIVEIEDTESPALRLTGFIGRPDTAKKTTGNQYFFVDGRFFRSPYLHKAVMNAYSEFCSPDLTPAYFLFLEVDTTALDVNIHPAKTEVKFEDDSIIFQILYARIRETLGRHCFGASIDFEAAAAPQLPQIGRSFEEYNGPSGIPDTGLDPDYDPFRPEPSFSFDGGTPVERPVNAAALFEERQTPVQRQTLVVHGKYIVTAGESGMIIVNVRRASERILYERNMRALQDGEHVTQAALFPVTVNVGTIARTVFDGNAAMLASLGFAISPEGADSVVVSGVPEGYSCEEGKVEQMVHDLVVILSDGSESLPEIMKSSLASKLSLLGALNSEAVKTQEEAQKLLEDLFRCSNSELTPSGRRISRIVAMDEIDKMFV